MELSAVVETLEEEKEIFESKLNTNTEQEDEFGSMSEEEEETLLVRRDNGDAHVHRKQSKDRKHSVLHLCTVHIAHAGAWIEG